MFNDASMLNKRKQSGNKSFIFIREMFKNENKQIQL